MSDAHTLHMLMGIWFGGLAGKILADGILLITDRKLDRKTERELAKQRDERDKARKEQGARETREWIKRQQQRIQEQQQEKQQRIQEQQQEKQRLIEHWQQWRDFLDGDGIQAPCALEYQQYDQSMERICSFNLLERCKSAGLPLTADNLAQVFEGQYQAWLQADDVVSEALWVMARVRYQADKLPMAA